MKPEKTHVVRAIDGFRHAALCGSSGARRFEGDDIRKVTCKRCRRMARKLINR